MKNILKKRLLFRSVILCVMVLMVNIFSMRMTKMGNKAFEKSIEAIKQQQYFIYALDTAQGIWVDKKIIEQNSPVIKMLSQRGKSNKIGLPFSIEPIKLAIDVLRNKDRLNELSLAELIDVANVFDFLRVPSEKFNIVLINIKQEIDQSDEKIINNKALKELNPDLQKLIMIDPIINCLTDLIIAKYAVQRRKILLGHQNDVQSVAFSPDGTKIVSGCVGKENNLILWDVSSLVIKKRSPNILFSLKNYESGALPPEIVQLVGQDLAELSQRGITHQVLNGHSDMVELVVFSPDGTKFLSVSSRDKKNNLILWDVNNLHNKRVLVGHPQNVKSVAFSPDGTKIVSGCWGKQNNLFLWDVNNPSNQQELIGHPDDVNSVAFSPDGKYIISGCVGNQNNLILWDISNVNNITHKVLAGHPYSVMSVAFDRKGKKIVSGCAGSQSNLILWDISDQNNITHQVLRGHLDSVESAVFNSEGTQIVSGCIGSTANNLILWHISNLNMITHQKLSSGVYAINSVAFSPDGRSIVSGGTSTKNNLMLWTLLTDREALFLNQLKQYDIEQLRLIYQLCLEASADRKIILKQGSEEYDLFMTLPQDMQQGLNSLLSHTGREYDPEYMRNILEKR